MSTASLAPAERARLDRHQAVICAIQRTTPEVISAGDINEVLGVILGDCAEKLGYLYPSLVLLDVRSDMLVGQVFSSPATWDSLRRVAESDGLPIDNILGRRGDRRASSSRSAGNANVPPDAVAYRLDAIKHPMVRTFLERRPYATERLHDIMRPHVHASVAEAVQRALGIHSIVLLPLFTVERCLGMLVIACAPASPFTDSEVSKLGFFTAQVAMSIENARLRQDLRNREHQVSLLLKETIDAQEDERERICLEIHDGVAQTLAPVFHYLQTLDSRPGLQAESRLLVRKAGALVREAIREAREVIATLRPPALDAVGLVATLQFEMDELQIQTGWVVNFDADDVRFPKDVETALYRIVHEAVNNARKHAQAKKVTVRVKHEQGCIVAEIQDNGVGFDSFAVERQLHRKGAGLLSMRKRAELLGGSFHLTSSPGTGTQVRVNVPLLVYQVQQDGSVDEAGAGRSDRSTGSD